jgi:hypothetical protein
MQFNFAKPALGVVYCTTMSRPDSVLTLALLYGFEGKREARVSAIALTGASLGAAHFCDAVRGFYVGTGMFVNSNRYLPVGLDADAITNGDPPMLKAAYAKYPSSVNDVSDTAEVTALVRNSLTAQNDGNAVVVLSASAAKLLAMLGLPGVRDLVAAKVKMLVISDGLPDPASSRQLLAEWPTRIVLCGIDVGDALPFPGESLDKDFAWSPAHPVADAYRAFRTMPYDTPSQDLAAIYYAVHPDSEFFHLSEPGTIEFTDDGRSTFRQSPEGKHRQLVIDATQKDSLIRTFVEITSAKPVPRPQFRRRAADADAAKAAEEKKPDTAKQDPK